MSARVGQSYLLHVYAVARAAKYQACTHCLCKTSCLITELGGGLLQRGGVVILARRFPLDLLSESSQNGHIWCPPKMVSRFC